MGLEKVLLGTMLVRGMVSVWSDSDIYFPKRMIDRSEETAGRLKVIQRIYHCGLAQRRKTTTHKRTILNSVILIPGCRRCNMRARHPRTVLLSTIASSDLAVLMALLKVHSLNRRGLR